MLSKVRADEGRLGNIFVVVVVIIVVVVVFTSDAYVAAASVVPTAADLNLNSKIQNICCLNRKENDISVVGTPVTYS